MNILSAFAILLILIPFCFQTDDVKKLKVNIPEDVSSAFICDACKYFINTTIKRLRGKKSESDVMSVMTDEICRPEIMDLKWPEMNRKRMSLGCLYIYDLYQEYIEKALIGRKDSEREIIRKLCVEQFELCYYYLDKQYSNYTQEEIQKLDKRKWDF